MRQSTENNWNIIRAEYKDMTYEGDIDNRALYN